MPKNGTISSYERELVNALAPPSNEAPVLEDIILDMDRLGQEIIEAEGDIALVAEKLLGSRHKQAQLLRGFTADQGAFDAFSLKSRAFIIAKLLHTFSMLNTAVVANVASIPPTEVLKALTRVADTIAQLSRESPSNTQNNTVNVFETAMRTFPGPVQDAMKRLLIASPQQMLSAGDDDS